MQRCRRKTSPLPPTTPTMCRARVGDVACYKCYATVFGSKVLKVWSVAGSFRGVSRRKQMLEKYAMLRDRSMVPPPVFMQRFCLRKTCVERIANFSLQVSGRNCKFRSMQERSAAVAGAAAGPGSSVAGSLCGSVSSSADTAPTVVVHRQRFVS